MSLNDIFYFNHCRVSKSKAAIGFDYDEGVGMSAGSFREEADGEEESSDDEYSESHSTHT